MCGIFGIIANTSLDRSKLETLAQHSQQRGKDSSGLILYDGESYKISRADYNIERLFKNVKPYESSIVLGHSRLITNGLTDNQPVVRENIAVLHNGIIVNK